MRFLILYFTFFSLTNLFGQEEKEPEQIVSFEVVNAAILRVFPEAYEDFLTICFMRQNEFILPESATFLIADKYFKKGLNQKELDKRAQLLLDQLELSPACQSIHGKNGRIKKCVKWRSILELVVRIYIRLFC